MARFAEQFTADYQDVKVAVDVSGRSVLVPAVMVSLRGSGFSAHAHLTANEARDLAHALAEAAGVADENAAVAA